MKIGIFWSVLLKSNGKSIIFIAPIAGVQTYAKRANMQNRKKTKRRDMAKFIALSQLPAAKAGGLQFQEEERRQTI